MPAKSKSQQRLFGMALAVRKGELKRSDVWKEVLDIVDSDMTNKEIEDFATTSHKGLKEEHKEMKPLIDYIIERQLGDGWKEWSEGGYQISMLAFDEDSMWGSDKGKISKLCIRKNGKTVCNYDRGWDVKPTKDVKNIYDDILNKYN